MRAQDLDACEDLGFEYLNHFLGHDNSVEGRVRECMRVLCLVNQSVHGDYLADLK
jgi:hypothetical protein